MEPTNIQALAGVPDDAWLNRCAGILPGLIFAVAIALCARLLAPYTGLPPVFLALATGMLVAPFAALNKYTPGLVFGGREVLRAGVALLGAQITFGQLVALGFAPFAIAISALFVTLGLGYWIARSLKLSPELSWLLAGAVAICGASATLAIAAVLPRSKSLDENAAATVAGVTVIGTLAMLVYPSLARAIGFDAHTAGIFMGASLHEVVQAVGAGFSFSPEAGEMAATVKLVRVACLAPVILLVSSMLARHPQAEQAPSVLPWFVLGFLMFAALASVGAFPPVLLGILAEGSRFCLLVAIAALGTKVSVGNMVASGARPIVALGLQTVLIALFSIMAIFVLQIG